MSQKCPANCRCPLFRGVRRERFNYVHRYHNPTTPAAVSRTLFKLIDYTLGFSLPHSLSRSIPAHTSQLVGHLPTLYTEIIIIFYVFLSSSASGLIEQASNGNKLRTVFTSEKSRLCARVISDNMQTYGNRGFGDEITILYLHRLPRIRYNFIYYTSHSVGYHDYHVNTAFYE